MVQQKTKEEKTFDWLERTIERLLNDFEGGITGKEETMNQFFELIFDKLVAEIQELRDKFSSQLEPLSYKEPADILEKIITAWESLEGNKRYSDKVLEEWLITQMKPAIDNARKYLGKPVSL